MCSTTIEYKSFYAVIYVASNVLWVKLWALTETTEVMLTKPL